MKLTAPSNKSSHIHSLGYEPDSRTLGVKFHNNERIYHYHGVTSQHYVELSTHESPGGHFRKTVLNKFKHTKI